MYKLIIADDEPFTAEQLALAFDWASLGFVRLQRFLPQGKK